MSFLSELPDIRTLDKPMAIHKGTNRQKCGFIFIFIKVVAFK